MENRNNMLIIILIAIVILLSWGLTKNFNERNQLVITQVDVCKEDSLRSLVYQLQAEIKSSEDGWDSREARYEDIINEYEFIMSYLHDYHPNAYRDVHRVTGMKEKYTREIERENKKRLNINKF